MAATQRTIIIAVLFASIAIVMVSATTDDHHRQQVAMDSSSDAVKSSLHKLDGVSMQTPKKSQRLCSNGQCAPSHYSIIGHLVPGGGISTKGGEINIDKFDDDIASMTESLAHSRKKLRSLMSRVASQKITDKATSAQLHREIQALRRHNRNLRDQIRHAHMTAGAPGNPGAEGKAGPRGHRGYPGRPGTPGVMGVVGPPGHRGEAGHFGARGAPGQPGLPGVRGGRGRRGERGPQGGAGAIGERGPLGPTGLRGPEGPRGPDGLKGSRGPPGFQGPTGKQGPAGPIGATGPAGEAGMVGAVGPTGETGRRGPQGLPGVVGIVGKPGLQGAPGPRGYEGPVGIPGGVGVVGPAGLPGNQGPAGIIGAPGPVGAPGPRGLNGINGRNGKAGANGVNGALGKVGPRGKTGAMGEPGKHGIRGVKGAPGREGPRGERGARGARGLAGRPGSDGSAGPRGFPGKRGVKTIIYKKVHVTGIKVPVKHCPVCKPHTRMSAIHEHYVSLKPEKGKVPLIGAVVNYLTNEHVRHAKVVLKQDGKVVKKLKANKQGHWGAMVKPGKYKVIVKHKHFIGVPETITAVADQRAHVVNGMSPHLKKGEVRFVLVWGHHPEDLDARLVFPQDKCAVVYYKRECDKHGVAKLNVDSTRGSGPETITLEKSKHGTYHYQVHQYSKDGSLAKSEARVIVFEGGKKKPEIFHAGKDGKIDGKKWNVLKWEVDSKGKGKIVKEE